MKTRRTIFAPDKWFVTRTVFYAFLNIRCRNVRVFRRRRENISDRSVGPSNQVPFANSRSRFAVSLAKHYSEKFAGETETARVHFSGFPGCRDANSIREFVLNPIVLTGRELRTIVIVRGQQLRVRVRKTNDHRAVVGPVVSARSLDEGGRSWPIRAGVTRAGDDNRAMG